MNGNEKKKHEMFIHLFFSNYYKPERANNDAFKGSTLTSKSKFRTSKENLRDTQKNHK